MTAEETETLRGELQAMIKSMQDESLFLNNKISQLKKDLEARHVTLRSHPAYKPLTPRASAAAQGSSGQGGACADAFSLAA